MATEFKTLTFPNNEKGQREKIKALQKATAEGWEVVSETITQGRFKGGKACCLFLIFAPCALCAGSTDGTINVTLKKESSNKQSSNLYTTPVSASTVPNVSEIKCKQCGSGIKTGDIFCPKCGAKLEINKCKQCGHDIKVGESFCAKCGTKVDKENEDKLNTESEEVPSEILDKSNILSDQSSIEVQLNEIPTESHTASSNEDLHHIQSNQPVVTPNSDSHSYLPVRNHFAWAIIVAAVAPGVISMFVPVEIPIVVWMALDLLLAYFDAQEIKSAGFDEIKWGLLWAFFFCPVYLYIRASKSKQKPVQFYISLLLISIGLLFILGNYSEHSSTPVIPGPPVSIPQTQSVQEQNFFELCSSGTPQQVEIAIRNGAKVNEFGTENWTPLMYAAKNNKNLEVLSILINAGANVNAVSTNTWTPLKVAALNDNPQILSVLIKAGANVNAQEGRRTALMWAAAENKNPQVIAVLLDSGADVNAVSRDDNKKALDFANENSALRGTAVYERLKALTIQPPEPSTAIPQTQTRQEQRPEVRPGCYVLDRESISGAFTLFYGNNTYAARIELESNRGAESVFESESTTVTGNKVTMITQMEDFNGNPVKGQIIVTLNDGNAVIEANDVAESLNGISLSYSGTYKVKYYENANMAMLANLVDTGKVPQYIQNEGKFYYESSYYAISIAGDNVRLRSQPNTESRIIATVSRDKILGYKGGWTSPTGEEWVLGKMYDSAELVWVYGKYAELIEREFD